jgi:hypothetical protein
MAWSGLTKRSLPIASIVTGTPAWVVALSSFTSATGVTVMASVAVAVPPSLPSLTV